MDRDRLRQFITSFFGYGNWNAPLWFLGMEEGGGADVAELQKRLDAWSGAELEDLASFHKTIGAASYFDETPKLQRTWAQLSRIALAAEGLPTSTEAVREHQATELGRAHGRTALVELLPLPSRSLRHWIYGDLGLPELADRDTYDTTFRDARIRTLAERVKSHEPAFVVAYGRGYRESWERITGSPFRAHESDTFEETTNGRTRFILAPHPAAKGITNAVFARIGEHIAR